MSNIVKVECKPTMNALSLRVDEWIIITSIAVVKKGRTEHSECSHILNEFTKQPYMLQDFRVRSAVYFSSGIRVVVIVVVVNEVYLVMEYFSGKMLD